MQGLAFWIGHRRALFPHYPLAEGALVAELCNLIQVSLRPEDESLLPEVRYSRLVAADSSLGDIPARARVDLALADGPRTSLQDGADLSTAVKAVVEVKRASAGNSLIDDDLRRLARLRAVNPRTRAFLVVASEAEQPRRFVRAGKSRLGKKPVPGMHGWHFRVRRTTKAAASFSALKAQHYICMLEVFKDSTR